jgi:hypothetical protein
MLGHTPGPWRVPLDEPYDRDRPTYFLEDGAGQQLMLLARLPEAGPQENKANARLISAAPELLAAVEAMADFLGWDLYADDGIDWSGARQIARDAARKARGGA